MGYSPWGHKESGMTEATQHALPLRLQVYAGRINFNILQALSTSITRRGVLPTQITLPGWSLSFISYYYLLMHPKNYLTHLPGSKTAEEISGDYAQKVLSIVPSTTK